MNPEILDELSQKLASALPDGVTALQEDMEKNIRAALGGIMQKMNLVSREEFDIQQKVLARTREKLASLEKQLTALEKTIK
ncbi:MAG TPA: accessory factor UbiK family protein [Gammaproteobacteria bacterium]|nr:accessory factor UbiK family protein [Gammaproteobacteria bacterium]